MFFERKRYHLDIAGYEINLYLLKFDRIQIWTGFQKCKQCH